MTRPPSLAPGVVPTPPTMGLRARTLRSRIGAARRINPDADVTELQREFRAERLAEHIVAVVGTAPALTPAQRARLVSLLDPEQAAA